nr:MAG TPA: hypothetical protein [Bacteriophage sp.]
MYSQQHYQLHLRSSQIILFRSFQIYYDSNQVSVQV